MLTLRPSAARGSFDYGWLDTKHTFSFARYYDPAHMGLGPLRVINEDKVAPGKGFGRHPHDHMEILSYVVSGRLTHQDTAGHAATVGPGGVQLMSAGTGLEHSEFNGSKTEPVHFLQVWIEPSRRGTAPGYQQADAPPGNPFRLIAAPEVSAGGLRIGQDVRVWGGVLGAGATHAIELGAGRAAWVQVIRGELTVNGQRVRAGDGLAVTGEARAALEATGETEALVFDLP